MSTPEEMEKKLKEIVARVFKMPVEQVRLESRFRDDLGADSLDLVLLLYEVEDHLGINLSDDEAKQIQTVGDALRMATQIVQE
jgi:acyl carrier protein